MKIKLSDFSFTPRGHGHYYVTYTSPLTSKKFSRTTDDMPLIDVTKNADSPKRRDLEILKRMCKTS